MRAPEPEIFEVVPGIWCVREKSASAYLVKLLPGGVLVDAGPDPAGSAVMLAMQRARVGLRSLRALLLTHADYDASAGAGCLSERSGAPVLVSEAQAALLRRPRRRPRARGLRRLLSGSASDADVAPSVRVPAEAALRDGQRVHEHFEVAAAGGPEGDAGHLAFYFHPSRALFSGDAVDFHAGRCRGAGGFDLRRLRERFPEVRAVLPNHGAPRRDGVAESWAEIATEETAES